MKLRIISDGTPKGTRIVSLRGEKLEDVTALTWSIRADGTAKVTMELVNVPIDVIGQVEEEQQSVITCPICDAQFIMATKQAGRYADYKDTRVRWKCGTCKKQSYAEDWFDTSGMN